MKNKQDITVLEGRDVTYCVSMRGLKARKSLAHISTGSITMCHGRLSTPEAPAGRNLFLRITPYGGPVNVMRSVRRVLPCTIDYRVFSPALNKCLTSCKFLIPNYQLLIVNY
jgi:hypothetical protein